MSIERLQKERENLKHEISKSMTNVSRMLIIAVASNTAGFVISQIAWSLERFQSILLPTSLLALSMAIVAVVLGIVSCVRYLRLEKRFAAVEKALMASTGARL